MEIIVAICAVLCIFCLIMALIFAVFKEKAAKLISGFRAIPSYKRKSYDVDRLVKDHRDLCFLLALIAGAGALLGLFLFNFMALAGLVVWLIVFFSNVSLDAGKAFDKYRKQ